jgi:hypothetical protein
MDAPFHQGTSMQDQIAAPVAKAASAIGAGVGTSAMSITAGAQNFLPQDLAGWLAAAASGAALIYSLTLLGEWWWKRFWKPLLKKHG